MDLGAEVESTSGVSVDTSVTLRVENALGAALRLDGLWLRRGHGVRGSVVAGGGVEGGGTAELVAEGQGEVEALLWFRAPAWPFAVVTLTFCAAPGGSVAVAGEWARLPPADARELLKEAAPLGTDEVRESGGLLWRRAADGAVVVTALPACPTALALAPRQAYAPRFAMPTLALMASWVGFSESSRQLSLELRLQQLRVASPDAGGVADRAFFDLLGLEPGASPQAVRAAWRWRARELHPDVVEDVERGLRFDEVREAFRVLSDPVLRARYEALGFSAVDEVAVGASSGFSLRGVAAALSLLLGAWALRPLLGGALTPPLGLSAKAKRRQGEHATTDREEPDAVEEVRLGVNTTLRLAFGFSSGQKADDSEALATMSAALATSSRLESAVEGHEAAFERALRLELKSFLTAGAGTLAPQFLARWGAAQANAAAAWLAREAPQAEQSGFQASALEGVFARAAQVVGLAGAGAASFASLPLVVAGALVQPDGLGQWAAEGAIVKLVEVAYGAALLEVDRRGAAAALLLLEDTSKPWQIRWRTAQAMRRFGEILQEEGEPKEPNLESFVRRGSEGGRR